MNIRWSEQEVNQLANFEDAGLTAIQISKLMNKTVVAVQQKLHRLKHKEVVHVISAPELAEQIGMIRTNINQYIKRSGITPHFTRKRTMYYKTSDIQNWLNRGFALSCIKNHNRKNNEVWDMIDIAISKIGTITTRDKVCSAFNIGNSTVGYWISLLEFPKPISRIHNVGHIFDLDEVESWATKNNKTHGSLKITVEEFIQNHGLQDGE